jgi:hypothetical protein
MIPKTPNIYDLKANYYNAREYRKLKENQFNNADSKFAEILSLELKAAELREQIAFKELRGGNE